MSSGLTGVIVIACVAAVALAQDQGSSAGQSSHIAIKEADVHWGDAPPALPRGVKLAVLQGHPNANGFFTIRLKTPANYKIPLHTHPTDEVVTVLSGKVDFTLGNSTPQSFGPGSFLVMPAGMQHAASMKNQAIVQVSGQGPFVINYVNPSDDPRQAKQ
jgi:quercetin dioxygenase-like cupin family protein